jgi:hypothetical protein
VIVVHHPSGLKNVISANSISVLSLSVMLVALWLLTALLMPERSGVLLVTGTEGSSTLNLPGGRPVAFLAEIVRFDQREQQNNYMIQKYD